jgi:hypothetical protein
MADLLKPPCQDTLPWSCLDGVCVCVFGGGCGVWSVFFVVARLLTFMVYA